MTAAETIVAALQDVGMRVVIGPSGARAQCPVHGSRGLSLSVRAEDGRARVTCFAGCEDDAVLEAIGLTVADLFDPETRGRPDHAAGQRRRAARRAAPEKTPWDEAMESIGLRPPYPSIEHVLNRMVQEQEKVRRQAAEKGGER